MWRSWPTTSTWVCAPERQAGLEETHECCPQEGDEYNLLSKIFLEIFYPSVVAIVCWGAASRSGTRQDEQTDVQGWTGDWTQVGPTDLHHGRPPTLQTAELLLQHSFSSAVKERDG